MQKKIDLTEALLNAWKTTHQVSAYLIKHIPPDLWNKKIPGYQRKTISMLAIHLHNTRCRWIKSIANEHFGNIPSLLDTRYGTRKEVAAALSESHKAMLKLLNSCIENGGMLPTKPAWLNFPNDVMHLLAYFTAHEAHHRGQIIMAARQLGMPLSLDVTSGVWQWIKRLKEARRN